VMAIVGSALDYGRASAARTELQRAVDAAALTLVRDAASLDEPKLKERGRTLVRGLLKDLHGFSTDTITVSRNAKTIRVAASGTMKTAFMAVAGFDGIAIGSEAESTWGSTRIELALVLDNTGSMNEGPGGKRKIDALKTSARDLLDTLRGVAHDHDTVKV
jgi:Flp pilus assembly protein TadG